MDQYVNKNGKQLRCGITTGTCATAAAQAAALQLLAGVSSEKIQVHTPKGITVSVPVELVTATENYCEYLVRKDSGDDPDVTNGAEIHARVERLPSDIPAGKLWFETENYPGLYLDGGEGIGRITRAGLEQQMGQAAVNKVPRAMIFQAVGDCCREADCTDRLLITVSIPAGKELAAKTFNPMLGIEGGISVLGTSGILEPMSEKAIIDTIETQIRQLHIQGEKSLLVTPGNYGMSYVSDYLKLDLKESIKCSNYVGDTLDLAVSYEMTSLLLVGNIGKLVKLAAGIMNTHSRVADGRCELLALHTVLCGGTREQAERIMDCIGTEEILGLLEQWKLRQAVTDSLCRKIDEYIKRRVGGKLKVGVILFSEKYGYLGETEEASELTEILRSGAGVKEAELLKDMGKSC